MTDGLIRLAAVVTALTLLWGTLWRYVGAPLRRAVDWHSGTDTHLAGVDARLDGVEAQFRPGDPAAGPPTLRDGIDDLRVESARRSDEMHALRDTLDSHHAALQSRIDHLVAEIVGARHGDRCGCGR